MFSRMDVEAPPLNPVSNLRFSRVSRGVSSATTALLVVLAGSGASTHLDGVLIGIPSASNLVLAGLLGAAVWASGLTGLGGFLLPASAVLFGALFPPASSSLLLFSGRPLLTFVLAALFLAVVASGKKLPKALLLPVFFALYACVAYQAQTRVGPDGDEPQYLMVAESLIRDHDLALDQDFKEKRYSMFFSRPLEPHFRIRGSEGQIYSVHAVGLSLLILPAYWLFGYSGASFFMAFLAALLVREVRGLVRDLTGDETLAEGTAWLVGLSPPVIHFAGLIFTEIPAALLMCAGLRAAIFGRTSRAANVAALCAAALPWLNVRYGILSFAIVGALGWSERGDFRRRLLSPVLILTVSALAIGLYHFALWGFFDPRRVYGRTREFSLDILPEGLPGLFFDQEFGLFVYAPIFVLSLAGLIHLWRQQRVLAIAGLFAGFGVLATASVWPMWRGGFNPPARFLVPLVPILAAALALSLRRGIRPSTALLAGWSLWCGLSGAFNIDTIHRDREGVAPFFRAQSGAREWTVVLPSFVLSEDRPTRVLALPWAVLLGVPLLLAAARPAREPKVLRNRDALLASAAFMATAVFADRLSPRARSPERDAARLVGSPSLLLPSFRFQRAAEAAWPLDLLYEPHRAPAGLVFARAMTFGPGPYSMTLSLTDGAPIAAPPSLVLRHRHSGRAVRVPMTSDEGGLRASFAVDLPGDYDLTLIGGEPMSIVRVRIVAGHGQGRVAAAGDLTALRLRRLVEGGEVFKHFVRMLGRRDLRVSLQDHTVRSDEVRDSTWMSGISVGGRAIGDPDLAGGVAQQREGKRALLRERLILGQSVETDSEDFCLLRFELADAVAEPATLNRSARRVGLGIKPEQEALSGVVGKLDGPARVIGSAERRGDLAFLQHDALLRNFND